MTLVQRLSLGLMLDGLSVINAAERGAKFCAEELSRPINLLDSLRNKMWHAALFGDRLSSWWIGRFMSKEARAESKRQLEEYKKKMDEKYGVLK